MTLPTVHPFLMGILRGTDLEALVLPALEDQAWEKIVRDATQQELLPILYRWLKTSNSGRMPPALILDQIKERVWRLTAWNLVLAQELASILRAFEVRRVACVPLRGLALAELLYGDITVRPMGDIDLLVHKKDLPAVAETLNGLGFQELDRRLGFAQAFYYTLEFFKDRHNGVIVEPHWTIAYPPFGDRVNMDMVWKRCVRGQVVGIDTWLLDRADLIVHLCLHLIHHSDKAPLLWFYELDRFLRQEKAALDWSQVLRVARQTGLELLLVQVLGKVMDLFDSPIPDHVVSELRSQLTPHRGRVVGASVESRMVRLLANYSGVHGGEQFALLFTIKGLRPRFRYALALLFPSPQFMLLRYGLSTRKPLGLYYIARVVHLSWKGLKWLAGLLVSGGTPRQ